MTASACASPPPTGGERSGDLAGCSSRQVLVMLGDLSLQQWWAHAARLAEGVVISNMLVDTTIRRPLRYVEHTAVDLGELGQAWPIQGAAQLLESGEGNCLDLSCLFAAQWRKRGHWARVEVIVNPSKRDAHSYVAVGGRRFDPKEYLPNGVL